MERFIIGGYHTCMEVDARGMYSRPFRLEDQKVGLIRFQPSFQEDMLKDLVEGKKYKIKTSLFSSLCFRGPGSVVTYAL